MARKVWRLVGANTNWQQIYSYNFPPWEFRFFVSRWKAVLTQTWEVVVIDLSQKNCHKHISLNLQFIQNSCSLLVMKILFFPIFSQLSNVFHEYSFKFKVYWSKCKPPYTIWDFCQLRYVFHEYSPKSDANWSKRTPPNTLWDSPTDLRLFKPNLWRVTNLVLGGVSFHFSKDGQAFLPMNCQFSEMCILLKN